MTKQEIQELAAWAEEVYEMWQGPMTSQDQADLALVQQEMGYSSTLNELNLFDTRRYTDGEHRFYSVRATTPLRSAEGNIIIIEMKGEPAYAVRQSFHYKPR
jgi:hypothetical protein